MSHDVLPHKTHIPVRLKRSNTIHRMVPTTLSNFTFLDALNTSSHQMITCQTIKAPGRRVRIAEDKNVVYDNSHCTKDDVRILWYSREDYRFFYDALRRQIRKLNKKLKDPADGRSLCHSLVRLHEAFLLAQSTNDIAKVLESTTITLDEDSVGLYDYVIPSINEQFRGKRKVLLQQLRSLHCQGFQEKMIRNAAIRNSRTSRYFARYMAFISDKDYCTSIMK